MKNISFPAGCTDIEQILSALDEYGYVIIEKILHSLSLTKLEDDLEPYFDERPNSKALFFGFNTKRIEALLSKSKTVQHMAMNKYVLAAVEHVLGPNCDKIQLNLTQGIRINPGERAQILHPDTAMFPIDNKPFEFMVNALWAYSDFTKENGATRIVPGSHKWHPDRKPTEQEIHYAEMPAGSVLLYKSSLLHGGGENKTTAPRTGIAISYILGWLRQSENQYLSYPPEVALSFPPELQSLVGYHVHKPNLGWVHGHDPIHLLDYKNKREAHGAEDFLTTDQKKLLEDYYADGSGSGSVSLTSHNHKASVNK